MSKHTAKERIGFIGLGIMGRPMCRNLLQAGYAVTAYNRSPGPRELAAGWGARLATSPAEVAEDSDVVITIVRDSAAVEEVALGPAGIRAGARPGLVVVDMSTISPAVTRRVAAALARDGVGMLDAPVSGGQKGAEEARLSIMVGGPADLFERCRPIFAALGTRIVHLGPIGSGQTVKLCNQVICGLNLLAVSEGLLLAARAGADLDKVLEVVTAGAAGSWMLENLGPSMRDGDFAPGFTVDLQQKDLKLALAEAEARDLPLPGTALVSELFRAVQAHGWGGEGTQALVKALQVLAGVRPGPCAGIEAR